MAEIAAASKEQSAGIEQVTIAVGQMDKVTQSNAANAEESAAAAEELSSQAVQVRSMVGELTALVKGATATAGSAPVQQFAPVSKAKAGERWSATPKPATAKKAEKIIPLGEPAAGGFGEFNK